LIVLFSIWSWIDEKQAQKIVDERNQ